jgi:urease accessory protein UreF
MRTMGLAATEKELAGKASRFLKVEMKRAGVTYAELARRLKDHGLEETEASITSKLARGTFAATFLLAVLAALELEGLSLENL